jgi:hypothetical protein
MGRGAQGKLQIVELQVRFSARVQEFPPPQTSSDVPFLCLSLKVEQSRCVPIAAIRTVENRVDAMQSGISGMEYPFHSMEATTSLTIDLVQPQPSSMPLSNPSSRTPTNADSSPAFRANHSCRANLSPVPAISTLI